ncbi:MAG: HK97 family phage prohead protease [FCB group bacterium]|nr:HK97 family phage prohead protease [FCB group bacterium]
MKKETRVISMSARVEERKDGTPGSIYGYPIVYNKDSEDMGFIEQIAPGAARKALKRSDIRALKNHDASLIFGRAGVNLTIKEDKNGLRYEATPIDTKTFREVAEEVRLGLLTGQSFNFTVKRDEWSDLDTDNPKRTITEIDQIYDVGPVTYPAYQDTTVALRSMENAKKAPPTEETVEITIGDDNLILTGADRFERALKYISERSESSQAANGSDGADDAQAGKKSTDDDNILERIDNTLKANEV